MNHKNNLDIIHLYQDINRTIIYDVLHIIVNYYNNTNDKCDNCNKIFIKNIHLCDKCTLYLCDECHISMVKNIY